MADENKKGITVKIDAALHAQVKEYIESRGMTMAESSPPPVMICCIPKLRRRRIRKWKT